MFNKFKCSSFKIHFVSIMLLATMLILICPEPTLTQQTQGGLWDMPADVKPPDSEIRGQTPQFESPVASVQMSLMEYRENCLPLPDNYKEIMEQSAFREGTYSSAMGIIKSASNKCEASVEVKLYFESQKGQWTFGKYASEGADTGIRVMVSAVIQKYIIGMAVNPTLTIGIKFSDLLDKEFKQRATNKTIQEALELFRSTRGSSLGRINQIDAELRAKVAVLEKEIQRLTVKYGQNLEAYRPNHPYNRLNPSTAWQTFFEREHEFARQEASEKADLLAKIASLEIQRGVLNQYRRPLVEKSCEDVLKDLQRDCPHRKKTSDTGTAEPVKQPVDRVPKKMDSLTQKDKDALYHCICRCTINPTMGVGASYNPKPIYGVLSSPSCEDPRYGPCVGAGLGCWRKHMDSSGECFEQCLKEVNADKNSAVAEINKMRQDAFNDFIKEARGIIEEYIKFVPGVYKKKILGSPFYQESPTVLLAKSEVFLVSDSSTPGLLAQKEAPMTYLEMIKEKNRQGHPDRAIALVKSAESIIPERKGEIHNVLAEMAIMLSKATLNIVTELEFDEGLYMLNKASEIYKVGENSPLGQNIKRLIGNLQKWKRDWQVLQTEVPNCLSMLKQRQVCQCDRLFQAKIYTASASLTIYEYASSDRWNISTASGVPRSIPEKDKLFGEVKNALSSAKAQCDAHPVLRTPEMKALIDYETRKALEKSPYIDQSQLQKHSAPVICGVNAVRYAEKMLSTPELCDCHQDRLRAIIDIAKKDGEPMAMDFTVSSQEVFYGDRVILRLSIKGGRPPFETEMTGDYNYPKNSDNSRGFYINWQPDSLGSKVFKVVAKDSCGEVIQKEAYVNVKPSQAMIQCEAKWTEGTSLYNQKRYSEALVKFKENLSCAPNNQERRNYVAQLENTIRQQEAQRQACMNIRKQGDSLVQQKRLKEAIVQYREYLRCNPDRQIEDYIKQLEDTVKKEDEQRQRYEYARRLRSEGEQYERAKRIPEAIARYKESLRYLPDPALEKHIRDLELAMTRPTPTPQPTLIPTPQPTPTYRPPVATPSPQSSPTGDWSTNWGKMSLVVNHGRVTGNYTSSNGQILGDMRGNVLEGYWIQSSSGRRCPTTQNNSYYWGRLRFVFEGSRFRGNWSYCDAEVPTNSNHWTGERIK